MQEQHDLVHVPVEGRRVEKVETLVVGEKGVGGWVRSGGVIWCW